jgi:hypothetical protein
VELLNRASRYEEAEELAVAALSEVASPEEEAEIRLRLATLKLTVPTWVLLGVDRLLGPNRILKDGPHVHAHDTPTTPPVTQTSYVPSEKSSVCPKRRANSVVPRTLPSLCMIQSDRHSFPTPATFANANPAREVGQE